MNPTPAQTPRLLMYGRDPILLDTRSAILKMAGFDIYTVTGLRSFRSAFESDASPYRLAILCHSVPPEERESIAAFAIRSRTTVFQIETLIPPVRLVSEVSRFANPTVARQ